MFLTINKEKENLKWKKTNFEAKKYHSWIEIFTREIEELNLENPNSQNNLERGEQAQIYHISWFQTTTTNYK